ncbi:TolC family protein [Mucilaginibacter sp.]|jgi:outer membrane protein|uniref:TolC family protein n=1 Tax=Mucilaginibacter sp. TaxID=1882438 RepID=UPI003569FF0A
MPLQNKYALLLATLLLVGANLWAQDSTLLNQPLKWNLEQCITYAKKNNIQINSLRLSQQLSRQEYLLAKAARLPDLSASASQNFAHGNNTGGTGAGRSNFSSSGNYGLNSSAVLYNGGSINNNIQQKNLSIQSANLSIIEQENDITLQITQAYLTVLLDKENIIYNTDLVNTSKAQVALQQKRYTVGTIARQGLIQLQAQLATDQYTLVLSQNAQRGDLLTLKQLLLLPTSATFDIVKPDTIITPTSITPLQETEQAAFTTRPEIKNSELGVQIAEYDIKKALAGYKPSLSAGASLTSGYTNGQGYFSQLNNNFYQQVGVTLAIPIFTKRVVKTQVEEAKIAVNQAKLNLKDTRITLSQTVERTYINVLNAQQQYDAALQGYNFSKESYRIASEQLKVGVANSVDFLLQKNLFVQAQQAFIQAKYNVLLTQKIYDFYKGTPIKL